MRMLLGDRSLLNRPVDAGRVTDLLLSDYSPRPHAILRQRHDAGSLMSELPNCPNCSSEYTYEDGMMFMCPECANEWPKDAADGAEEDLVINDANGNRLNDGDTVSVIKDLKVKGSSSVVKVGTKVKGIRLVEGDHDIDCKIPGIGAMKLKSEFVKKV